MKMMEDAIRDLSYGNKLVVSRDFISPQVTSYSSCLLHYDGKICKEATAIELGNFLEAIPFIKQQLDQGYFYQISYIKHIDKYQSSIMRLKHYGCQKEYTNEIINNLSIMESKFLDSMIELEEKIARTMSPKKELQKVKIAS